ncbi:c-type cytochrome [Pseudohaliea rubra]|uniref:Cytochrome c5 n=1 Tax=Pseudohaliea rubra DSM 19751 TaxID=1265313 RepID=A0A095VW10_9GAMM|nr:c-type cytochrome [Pseudohaliea rubra]KGE05233.1 Cytochrome c5 [Pseudohaliea rubra DSM 19751]
MLKKILVAAAAGGLALSALAVDLTDEQRAEIAKRLEPVGSLCLQGDSSCVKQAGGAAAAGGGDAMAAAVDGEAVYNEACMACHTTGAGGAPMIGDAGQWAPRIEKGMDALHNSGINGVAGTAMMAKGGRADLSDEQVVAAVDYMVENSQ